MDPANTQNAAHGQVQQQQQPAQQQQQQQRPQPVYDPNQGGHYGMPTAIKWDEHAC